MIKSRLQRLFLLAVVVLLLPACTTMQTMYFSTGYTEIVQADHPSLQPYEGTPAFVEVKDMVEKSRAMQGEGFVMLGYSQFVSPLFPSLAESYSTKYGEEKDAAYVALETPKAGASNLHYYLVTYWARVDPAHFSFGGYMSDLPSEVLDRIGKNLNVVIVEQVVPGTPAAAAGIRGGDVILAVNETRVPDAQAFIRTVSENAGREIRVDISRNGESLSMPVRLAQPAPVTVSAAKGSIGYHDSPWFNTKPRDWSGLSIAAISATNASIMRNLQAQREQEMERAREQARRNLDYLDAQSTQVTEYSSRRGGGQTQQRSNGIPYVDQQRAMQQLRDMNQSVARQMDLQRLRNVRIFLNNAPNAYGSMGRWSVPVR